VAVRRADILFAFLC